MGLKTNNYKVEKLDITLPVAYAIIKDFDIKGEKATATFVIQSSRENALEKQPIEIKKFSFKVNRNENPYETAYKLVKTQVKYVYKDWDGTEKEKITNGIFYGWQDDIIES